MERLKEKLRQIDGRGYKAYKTIEGEYKFPDFALLIDHVQGDPFASPSRLRVRLSQQRAGFPPELFENESRRTALEDYLVRSFADAIRRYVRGGRGIGKSGLVAIAPCGQEILKRSAMVINEDYIEARFVVGLPARGRTILGGQASEILFQELPAVVRCSLFYRNLNPHCCHRQVELAEDQDFIRSSLKEKGLVAFLANGSVLPRRSGIDDRPMPKPPAVPLLSPQSLEVSFLTPNSGTIKGMGIPQGVTLIVGGGYHGKSTLLRALERGVYNHIPGDGREWVVTNPHAVKIRAEDGRSIQRVNISPFINNLPGGKDTTAFCTQDASGSTSQAANIIEALEMGAELLLVDEDTSATNFMIRDQRMQRLVCKEKEPITPFIDKIKSLHHNLGVSTVLVLGGSGDYFDVADLVIMMDRYLPQDVTGEAAAIARRYPSQRRPEGGGDFGELTHRIPLPESFNPRRGSREVKIQTKGLHTILFGTTSIDLSCVEQVVDPGQTRAVGDAVLYIARRYVDSRRCLRQGIEELLKDIGQKGLDILAPFGTVLGDYSMPRKYEIAAAINRMRTLKLRAGPKGEQSDGKV